MTAPVGPGPAPGARVGSVRTDVLVVPTDRPEADGTAAWTSTTAVVVRVGCEGVVGTGWTYGAAACAGVVDDLLAPLVVGTDPFAVPGTWRRMVRALRNAGRAGACGYALSAVDVALWDLKARLLGLPLADLWGRCGDVPVYGSGGFTTYDDQTLAAQLRGWVDAGVPRVKIKVGEDRGRRTDRDVARTRQAREVVGPEVELMVDANGAWSAQQAVRFARRVEDCAVTWLEEPVTSDDPAGLAFVRAKVDADVAAGEYGSDVTALARLCPVVDCLQVDATRCGGYTEWLRAAAVAAAHQLEVSAHCAPNLHVPVAAAVPNLRHVEWFHDHDRVESVLMRGAAVLDGPTVTPRRDAPGHGLELDDDAADPYRLESAA